MNPLQRTAAERVLEAADRLEAEAERLRGQGYTLFEAKAAALDFVAAAARTWPLAGGDDGEALIADLRDFAQAATRTARAYPTNPILEGRRLGAWRGTFQVGKALGVPVIEAPSPVGAGGTCARALCQGVTRGGRPCRREARPGGRYCWQHGAAR